MSIPFGLDLGSYKAVIACVQNRDINVLINEASNRSTPMSISFGEKRRFIGEGGKLHQISNLKNTVENLKRIIGMSYDDPEFELEKSYFPNTFVKMENGDIGIEVKFLGENHVFSITQLYAMLILSMKKIAITETKGSIYDVCVSVPSWYTEKQRRAVMDACCIADLKPVRMINEVTAAAVSYGVFKYSDFKDDDQRNIAFVDVGYSSFLVSITSVKKGELQILSCSYNKYIGGRVIDYALCDYFIEELKTKHNITVAHNTKVFYRLLASVEKVKKILSANISAPLNIESLYEDFDFNTSISREKFEEIISPMIEKLCDPVINALNDAKVNVSDLHYVEVIGGTSRIPCIKTKLSELFKMPLSFTLNQDEVIAKGCCFVCATHSPVVRVRPLKFEDYNPFSVSYYWDNEKQQEESLEVFPKGGSFPSTKIVTLNKTGDFKISARYSNPDEMILQYSTKIADWEIKGVNLVEDDAKVSLKLKLRNDPSGFYTVESAYTLVEKVFQELVPDSPKKDVPSPEVEKKEEGQDDENSEETTDKKTEEPKYKEVKKMVKRDNYVIIPHTFQSSDEEILKLKNKELELVSIDNDVVESDERKNFLEAYIYDLRNKLTDCYRDIATEDEKRRLNNLLTETNEWLYEEGENTTKAKYIAKYEELASIGNLVKSRYTEKKDHEEKILRENEEAKKAAEASNTVVEEITTEINASNKDQDESSQNNDQVNNDVEMN